MAAFNSDVIFSLGSINTAIRFGSTGTTGTLTIGGRSFDISNPPRDLERCDKNTQDIGGLHQMRQRKISNTYVTVISLLSIIPTSHMINIEHCLKHSG